jgi:cyclohexadieny/prephenate dehydrogenase / 3-phosphoshikimate 1-carboxyvinyltransferase
MLGTASRFLVQPSTRIHGETAIPGDKSISHRALMLGSLAEGDTEIYGFLESEDCLATLAALRQLGVPIEGPTDGHVIVHGHGPGALSAPAGPLDMGNAGTAMRLFIGLLASQPFDSQLIGDASLSRRPMERVAVPLRLMGAHIMTRDGRPPVDIHGGHSLCAIDYELPVPSAQVKSAILLAALRADGRTRVIEPAPSRDHTERMLASFGVEVLHSGGTIALQGGQLLRSTRLQVPGDFSSAAFFIVAGCLAAQQGLMLRGIGLNPTRTGLLNLLREMGADIRVRPWGASDCAAHAASEPVADIEVYASSLHGIKVAAADVPLAIDELPVFFIAAACASGETLVRGALELRVKESDRLAAMSTGLGCLGVEHELLTDGVWIRGASGFDGGVIDSHGDHRIAMAFAVAAARARAPIEIHDVASVSTSFPTFVASARAIGLQIELCA